MHRYLKSQKLTEAVIKQNAMSIVINFRSYK